MGTRLRAIGLATSVLLLAASALLAGCGVGSQTDVNRDALLGAVSATQALPRTIAYQEVTRTHRVEVTGTVADDFQWALAATVDGHDGAAEVERDDSRAVHVADPALITTLMTAARAEPSAPNAAPTATPGTVRGGSVAMDATQSLAALRAGTWIVDPSGSSRLLLRDAAAEAGTDPNLDALGVLDDVRSAVGDASGVVRYNREAVSYDPRLDFFPAPQAGEVRYDLLPPPLPARQPGGQGVAAGASRELYATPMFRSMAVYVRDGRVTAVRERIGITITTLEGVVARLADRGISVPDDLSSETTIEDAILRTGLQSYATPIRFRTMSTTLTPITTTVAISIPAAAVVGHLDAVGSGLQVLRQP